MDSLKLPFDFIFNARNYLFVARNYLLLILCLKLKKSYKIGFSVLGMPLSRGL